MNRRNFLKTVAATVAAGTAAVVAPSVGRGVCDRSVLFRPNPLQRKLFVYGIPGVSKSYHISKTSCYIITPYENPNPKTR